MSGIAVIIDSNWLSKDEIKRIVEQIYNHLWYTMPPKKLVFYSASEYSKLEEKLPIHLSNHELPVLMWFRDDVVLSEYSEDIYDIFYNTSKARQYMDILLVTNRKQPVLRDIYEVRAIIYNTDHRIIGVAGYSWLQAFEKKETILIWFGMPGWHVLF